MYGERLEYLRQGLAERPAQGIIIALGYFETDFLLAVACKGDHLSLVQRFPHL